jgi:hypothetical protein
MPTAPATSSAVAAATTQPSALPAAGVNFVMPNEVGKVLQGAQNDLHTNGVFYSKSHDMLGSRHQVLDRDWKVCNQNVPAGQRVAGNAEGMIDFGVVKLSENCP